MMCFRAVVSEFVGPRVILQASEQVHVIIQRIQLAAGSVVESVGFAARGFLISHVVVITYLAIGVFVYKVYKTVPFVVGNFISF